MATMGQSTSKSFALAVHDPDADNTAATTTIAADENERWVIDRLDFSYDDDPTAGTTGTLIVTDATNVFKIHVVKGNPSPLVGSGGNPVYVASAKNKAVTITLLALASRKGAINVLYH
jgi:hypothetical protein